MAGEADHFWEEYLSNQWEYSKRGPGAERDRNLSWRYDQNLFNFIGWFHRNTNYEGLFLKTPEGTPLESMASNPISMQFIDFLIRTHKPKRLLELGTYVGVSAIAMARAMPEEATLLTIENGEEFVQHASENARLNLSSKQRQRICFRRSDALSFVNDISEMVQGWFDFIFLDCDKDHYPEYLEHLTKLLAPGGLLVVDDVLFHGDVLNDKPTTPKGEGCLKLLQAVREMHWPKVLLPLANGILLIQKP